MLEKPDLPDAGILAAVQEAYGLPAARVTFLPLGWDVHTAVYRVDAQDGAAYFLKLRRGDFDELTVLLPRWLHDQGVPGVIAPLAARSGRLWGRLPADPAGSAASYTVTVYPFVEGKNAYKAPLSDRHWAELGAILKATHTAQLPPALRERLPVERFGPHDRERVRGYLAQAQAQAAPELDDPISNRLVDFLRARRDEIEDLLRRVEQLAEALQAHPRELVLCHSDAHPGNLHLAEDGGLYLVDWDNPILAPKELDLMFVGSGMGTAPDGRAYGEREEALFYQGYRRAYRRADRPGSTPADATALAYYRYARILVDVAEFCAQIFSNTGSGEDREQAFVFLSGSFLPGQALALARQLDRAGTER